ncbi:MAG: hypothetical protein DMG84_17280 [Acidobacteria bacterium]|nr:MAG: hypothetical protein AUI85_05925 [Acidobacteriales bacterium 13_1_40CM_3_55_5]PYX13931.1 MAG: hypothetical protein DMG84_17280 [Acidobacteriota bacterium]
MFFSVAVSFSADKKGAKIKHTVTNNAISQNCFMESPERDFGEKIGRKQNGPRMNRRGPPGGLFGIDQEVVTLRGPFGKLRVPTRLAAGGSTLNHR